MDNKKTFVSDQDVAEFTRWANEEKSVPVELPVGISTVTSTHLNDGRCVKCGTLLVMTWMGLQDCKECV